MKDKIINTPDAIRRAKKLYPGTMAKGLSTRIKKGELLGSDFMVLLQDAYLIGSYDASVEFVQILGEDPVLAEYLGHILKRLEEKQASSSESHAFTNAFGSQSAKATKAVKAVKAVKATKRTKVVTTAKSTKKPKSK